MLTVKITTTPNIHIQPSFQIFTTGGIRHIGSGKDRELRFFTDSREEIRVPLGLDAAVHVFVENEAGRTVQVFKGDPQSVSSNTKGRPERDWDDTSDMVDDTPEECSPVAGIHGDLLPGGLDD